MMKKLIAVLLSAVMALSLAACSASSAVVAAVNAVTDNAEPAVEVSASRGTLPAATVGDEVIACADLKSMYDYYTEMYAMYGLAAPTADEDIDTMAESMLDSLIESAMYVYQAKQAGVAELTAEQSKAVDDEVAYSRDSIMASFASQITLGENATEEEQNAAVIAAINSELASLYGTDMTFEDYLSNLALEQAKTYYIENIQKEIKSKATVSDEDVKNCYEKYLLVDEQDMTADRTAYFAAQDSFDKDGGRPTLYVPEGYARIKVLSVLPKGQLDAAYDEDLSKMSGLEAEYGAIALSAEPDEARMEEIRTEYAALTADADALYGAFTAEARAKAEEAYGELAEGGADFNALFAAYNEDQTYAEYPVLGEKGRLIDLTEDDGAWDAKIREAAANLKAGEFSGLIEIDGSFNIVYMMGEETPGAVPFENVENEIAATALEEAQETAWASQTEIWLADTSLITRYPDNYHYIGRE